MNQRPSLRTIATTLTCLLFPLTLLAGLATAAWYKSNNPDNVDITAGLAYLTQTMTAAIIIFAIITAVIVFLIVVMYRRDHNFSQAKLPLALLVTVIVLIVALSLVNGYSNTAQNQYLLDHERPTFDQ